MSISQIKSKSKFLQVFCIVLNTVYITPTYASNNLLHQESDTSIPIPHAQLDTNIKNAENNISQEDAELPVFDNINSLTLDQIENFKFCDKFLKDFYEIFNTIITEDIDIPALTTKEEAVIGYIMQSISGYPLNSNSLPFYQDSNISNIILNEFHNISKRSFIHTQPKTNNISCRLKHKRIFGVGGRRADKIKDPKQILKQINKDNYKIRENILKIIPLQHLQNRENGLLLIQNSTFHLVKNSIFFEARRLMTIETLYEKLLGYLDNKLRNNPNHDKVVSFCNRLLEIPLCLAAQKGRVAIMEYLILKGINPECKRCTFVTYDDEELSDASLSPYEYALESFYKMIDLGNENKETYIDIHQVISLLHKHKVTFEVSENTPKISEEELNAIKNSPVKYPSGLSMETLHAVWNCSLTEEQIKILKSLDAKSWDYGRRYTHL